MELLTEYVNSEMETIQVFTNQKREGFELWLVWDLNGVIVRVGQLVQVTSEHSAFNTLWAMPMRSKMKIALDKIITGEYGYGAPLLHYWRILGDRMGAGYHPIAVDTWEQKQLDKALKQGDYDDYPDDEPKHGMVSWLLDTDIVDIRDMPHLDVPDENIKLDSQWDDEINKLLGDDDD